MGINIPSCGSINSCKHSPSNDQQMLRLALFRSWYAIYWLILSLFLFPVVHSSNNFTSESVDNLLQELAFKAILHHRPHTGALYKFTPPPNLAGMEISVVRLRSKTLWRRGVNFSYIHIPSKTLPIPHVKRIFILHLDLGNWSSYYYEVSGYSLLSSVVGFTAYDASNVSSKSVTKLSLNTVGNPIEIRLKDLKFWEQSRRRRRKCAVFGANGTVSFSEMGAKNVCHSGNDGFFSIVAPVKRRKVRVWDLWLRGFVFGIVGLAVVCSVGIVIFKFVKGKNVHEMEREADEGVGLETTWIGASKMPSAAVTRTHPVLESAGLA